MPVENLSIRFEMKDEAAAERILRCPRPLLLQSGLVILKECQAPIFTETVFFDVVSTEREFSKMLVTVPITCFWFPWAKTIDESANSKTNTARVRLIVSPPKGVDIWVVLVLGYLVRHSRIVLPLLPPPSLPGPSD